MTKYKYEFVKIKAKFITRAPVVDYHKAIEDKTREGWRLVQIFAPGTALYGTLGYYELIFEKEV